MRRRAILSAALLGPLISGSADALSPPPAVGRDEVLRAFLRGGTLLGVLDGFMWVERYEPGGGLRGTHRGRSYAGRWEIEEHRLCTTTEGTRQCGALHSFDQRPIRDRTWYTLNIDGPPYLSIPVMYRTEAPWQRRVPVASLTGTVELAWNDGFTLIGREVVEWVRTGGPHGLQKDAAVSVSGVTDGIVVEASEVRRRA